MAIATKSGLFPASVSIPESERVKLIELLNARLADTIDLKTQAKQAHWNVKGMHFLQLHELFDQVAEHLDSFTDLIAERATAIGGVANGTVRQVASASSIGEYDLNAVNGPDHVRALSQRLAVYANAVRQAIHRSDEFGDATTADVFTEISRDVDKDLWFLEAHLQA